MAGLVALLEALRSAGEAEACEAEGCACAWSEAAADALLHIRSSAPSSSGAGGRGEYLEYADALRRVCDLFGSSVRRADSLLEDEAYLVDAEYLRSRALSAEEVVRCALFRQVNAREGLKDSTLRWSRTVHGALLEAAALLTLVCHCNPQSNPHLAAEPNPHQAEPFTGLARNPSSHGLGRQRTRSLPPLLDAAPPQPIPMPSRSRAEEEGGRALGDASKACAELARLARLCPCLPEATARDWAAALRACVLTRRVAEQLVASHPSDSLCSAIAFDAQSALEALLEGLRRGVRALVEEQLLADACVQDWRSNSSFRRGLRVSFGVFATALALLGLAFDLAQDQDQCAQAMAVVCGEAAHSVCRVYSCISASRVRCLQVGADLAYMLLFLAHTAGSLEGLSVEEERALAVALMRLLVSAAVRCCAHTELPQLLAALRLPPSPSPSPSPFDGSTGDGPELFPGLGARSGLGVRAVLLALEDLLVEGQSLAPSGAPVAPCPVCARPARPLFDSRAAFLSLQRLEATVVRRASGGDLGLGTRLADLLQTHPDWLPSHGWVRELLSDRYELVLSEAAARGNSSGSEAYYCRGSAARATDYPLLTPEERATRTLIEGILDAHT